MIHFPTGVRISQEILKRLRKDKRLKKIDIFIGLLKNCREQGFMFNVGMDNSWASDKQFTFCTYEHRNSDSIIVNGKACTMITINGGDLPYRAETKWAYWASFGAGEYDKAAAYLAGEILRFYKTGKVEPHESGEEG